MEKCIPDCVMHVVCDSARPFWVNVPHGACPVAPGLMENATMAIEISRNTAPPPPEIEVIVSDNTATPRPGTYRLVPLDAVVLDPEKCTPEAVISFCEKHYPTRALNNTAVILAFLAHAGVAK